MVDMLNILTPADVKQLIPSAPGQWIHESWKSLGGIEVNGMKIILKEVLLRRLHNQATKTDDTTPTLVFCEDGEFWLIGVLGSEKHFRNIKGMGFIHCLLRHANEWLKSNCVYDPSLSSGEKRRKKEAVQLEIQDAFYMTKLDRKARRDYTILKNDLIEKLASGDFNTPEEAMFIEENINFICNELKSNTIRDKKEESRRTSVQKSIKKGLRRIHKELPSLRRYLSEGTIKTGDFCSYVPDPNDEPRWILHLSELTRK